MAIALRLWGALLLLSAAWSGFTGFDLLRDASRYRDNFMAVLTGYSGVACLGSAVTLVTLGLLCWGMADLLERPLAPTTAKG